MPTSIGSKNLIPPIIGSTNVQSWHEVFGNPSIPLTEEQKSLAHMLPEEFRDIQVWEDLFQVLGNVFDDLVVSYLRNLYGTTSVRYFEEAIWAARNETVDPSNPDLVVGDQRQAIISSLLSEIRQLGMDQVDLSAFKYMDLFTLMKFVTEFWKEKGTEVNFSNFLSFILGFNISVVQLWTYDYQDFQTKANAGTPIWEGGIWYPTSHFKLIYDPTLGFDILNDSSVDYILQLIYFLAPIQVVLKWGSVNYDIIANKLIIGNGSVSVHIEYH